MSYHLYQTRGIVFASYPRSEADRILRLYTERYGAVTVYAKGVRLEKSKLRGALSVYSVSTIGFVAGKEVNRLTYAGEEHIFRCVSEEWERLRAAAAAASILCRIVGEGEEDRRLWELVHSFFMTLDDEQCYAKDVRTVFYAFETKLLSILGYLPSDLPPLGNIFLSSTTLLPRVAISQEALHSYADMLRVSMQYAGNNVVAVF